MRIMRSITTLLLILAVLAVPSSTTQSVKQVDKWFRQLLHETEKITRLHFYFHLVLLSQNNNTKNTYQVIRPPSAPPTNNSFSTEFGFMNMADNPITIGPSPKSWEYGRAQGFYARDDLKVPSYIMGYSFVFTAGPYKGGSLSVFSRNAVLEANYREIAIVGGTGVFRLGRGVAVLKTITLNPLSTTLTVECDAFVLHY